MRSPLRVIIVLNVFSVSSLCCENNSENDWMSCEELRAWLFVVSVILDIMQGSDRVVVRVHFPQ